MKYTNDQLLNELRDKISSKLQKLLAIESNRTSDLYEFARLCLYINQTIRDADARFVVISKFSKTTIFIDDASDDAITSRIIINEIKSFIAINSDVFISMIANDYSFISAAAIFCRILNFDFVVKKILVESRCFNCKKRKHMKQDCSHSRVARINKIIEETDKDELKKK